MPIDKPVRRTDESDRFIIAHLHGKEAVADEYRARIVELESERDAAKANAEKWEKRFKWMVKWYCGQLDCDLCVILDECANHDGEPQYDKLATAADKEE